MRTDEPASLTAARHEGKKRPVPPIYKKVHGMEAAELLAAYRRMVEAKVLRQVAENLHLSPVDAYDPTMDTLFERELKLRLGVKD